LFLATSFLITTRFSWKVKTIYVSIFLCAMLSVFIYFGYLVEERDSYYYSKIGSTYNPPLNHHVFWHSVHCGFGFLNNEYGIVWQDENAKETVAAIDPNAHYGSPEYNAILKNSILHLIKSDPHFFLRTIFAKLGVCLMYLLIFGNVGLLISLFYPKGLLIELPFAIGIAFNASFGIIVMPYPDYLLGLIAFSAIYGMVAIDFALDSGLLQKIKFKTHVSVK